MKQLLIFAGTTEGRRLVETLLSAEEGRQALTVTACVATEYGREVLESSPVICRGGKERLRIRCGRLTAEEMAQMMEKGSFDAAVDATHPYAAEVTAHIRQACLRTGTPYLRLLRERGDDAAAVENGENRESPGGPGGGRIYVESAEAAARCLDGTQGPVLLTTGSKELAAFTTVENYRERLYARVLPMAEVVEKCAELGFSGRRLICMQGPFSYEMNAALLRQTGARYLVTKETGQAGGFDEKLRAARDLGVCAVIIGRKPGEEGQSMAQVLRRLEELCGLSLPAAEEPLAKGVREQEQKSDWFPMFTNINNKRVVVVGAGKIALRRIRALLSFSCRLTVIAPGAEEEILAAAEAGRLRYLRKAYETADLWEEGEEAGGRDALADMVLAATDDRSCNHRVSEDCKKLGLPVNVADSKAESDFYFPGIARRGCVVVGVTAAGQNHGLARRVSARMRRALAEMDGEGWDE